MLCSSGQIIQLELLKNSDRKGALFQQNIGLDCTANCFFQSLNQAASIHSFIMAEKVCVCELQSIDKYRFPELKYIYAHKLQSRGFPGCTTSVSCTCQALAEEHGVVWGCHAGVSTGDAPWHWAIIQQRARGAEQLQPGSCQTLRVKVFC